MSTSHKTCLISAIIDGDTSVIHAMFDRYGRGLVAYPFQTHLVEFYEAAAESASVETLDILLGRGFCNYWEHQLAIIDSRGANYWAWVCFNFRVPLEEVKFNFIQALMNGDTSVIYAMFHRYGPRLVAYPIQEDLDEFYAVAVANASRETLDVLSENGFDFSFRGFEYRQW